MGLKNKLDGKEFRHCSHSPDTRSSSSVRNGKGLVQVHVANVASTGRRVGQANLSVKIGTVEINLTAVLVDNVASVLNSRLEHSESRRVGDLWKCQQEHDINKAFIP